MNSSKNPLQNQTHKKDAPSQVHGTAGAEMPDPAATGRGETEDRARDAFTGRPVILPEPKGDLADRSLADQEAELEERIAQARLRGRKR